MTPMHLSRPLRRALAITLGACAILLITGCPKRNKTPDDTGPVYTPEQQTRLDEAKAYADKRFQEEWDKATHFDRMATLKKLLADRYRIDLDALFPEGYAEENLKPASYINSVVQERAEADANKKYSPSMLLETTRLAGIEYPLFKVGDTVRIKTARGSILEGKLTAITDKTLSVDGTEIVLADVVEPDLACLIPERNVKVRDLYVRKNFKIARDDYYKQRIKELTPDVYREFAYIADDKRWVRIDEFIAAHLKADLDQMESTYNTQLDKEIRLKIELEMQKKGMLSLDAQEPAEPTNK